ncbi:uncharacterized protein LOC144468864 isoform X2 [Augochlora pura]
MRDGTITTRADVYTQEISDTSDSVIVTSDSTLLQASIPLMDYDAVTEEGHAYGHAHTRAHDYGDGNEGDGDDGDGDDDGDEARHGKSANSVTTPKPSTHPAASKPLTLNSDATDINDCTETIENDVCDAGPITRAVAIPIPGFESITDSRLQPQTQPRISRVQRNGIDSDKMKSVVGRNDNSRVVDCIYFAQQCCECVIF